MEAATARAIGRLGQIGADDVKGLRQKTERAAKADVGSIDADLRAPASRKIRKSGAVIHQPIIDLRHPVVRADQRIDHPVPVPGQQKRAPDVGLDVRVEELRGERLKGGLAIEAEMRRGKGAAGDTGEQVDLLEKGAVAPLGRTWMSRIPRSTPCTKAAERLPPPESATSTNALSAPPRRFTSSRRYSIFPAAERSG